MTAVSADVVGELDAIAARAAESARAPSLVAATFHRGTLAWQTEIGAAATQYRIGSITKTFTAVAVARLWERGVVELDDPIRAHVPDAPYGERTIRQLLAHSSGITAEPAGQWWERVPGAGWCDLVAANPDDQQVFAPGLRHHYSNLGFALLGELVARHRDGSWWEAVRQELVIPLGLNDTTYLPGDRAAIGTSRDPSDGRLFREPAHDAGAMAPAGQLWSTVHDLARWGDLLAVGSPGVIGAATIAQLQTAIAVDPETQHTGGYGLGLRLRWRESSTLVGHTGSMPGFLAALFVDPGTRVGAVLLANVTTGVDVERVVAQLVESSEPTSVATVDAPEKSAVGARAGVELAGEWYWGNTAMTLTSTQEGFDLVSDGVARTFVEIGADHYRGRTGYFAGEDLRVVRRSDGAPAYLSVVTFVLTRTPYDPEAPIPGGPPDPL